MPLPLTTPIVDQVCSRVSCQLLREVFAKTVLQVRSVFALPHDGHDALVADSDSGRATSNFLWQSRQVNS
jgi:hypothetical protein